MCAVVNKYVDAAIAAGKLGESALSGGGVKSIVMVATEEIAAADDDTSIYRFFKGLAPNLIPIDIKVYCDAITNGTDFDLGLYETSDAENPSGGLVVDADVFMDGQTLAAAITRGGGTANQDEAIDGLQNVDIANLTKKLYEHGGHTVKTSKDGYDICLTANTVGTVAGTVTIIAEFAGDA